MKSIALSNVGTSKNILNAQELPSFPMSQGKAQVLGQRSRALEPKDSLTIEQQKVAAKVLGQAFAKDSFMTYVLPEGKTRIQRLSKLFFPLIYCSQRYGEVNITPGGSGVLAWVPSKVFPSSIKFLELFRSGMLWLPWSVGRAAVKRLKVHDEVCESALLQHAPKSSAYIWAVGVHPDYAGQGLGKKMINAALDQMRQRGYSTCWLRTENQKNVGLYEHLGFKRVHTETPSVSGQQYWLMFQNL